MSLRTTNSVQFINENTQLTVHLPLAKAYSVDKSVMQVVQRLYVFIKLSVRRLVFKNKEGRKNQ